MVDRDYVPLMFFDWLAVIAKAPDVPDQLARHAGSLVRCQDGLSGRNVMISPAAIADRFSVSERTVKRWTSQLRELGYLVRTTGSAPGHAATYQLHGPQTGDTTTLTDDPRTGDTVTPNGGPRSEIEQGPRLSAPVSRTGATTERDPVTPLHSQAVKDARASAHAREELTRADLVQLIDQAAGDAGRTDAAWSTDAISRAVTSALAKGRSPADVLEAGLAAAANPHAHTAGAIGWRQRQKRIDQPREVCEHCQLPRAGHLKAGQAGDPHDFKALPT